MYRDTQHSSVHSVLKWAIQEQLSSLGLTGGRATQLFIQCHMLYGGTKVIKHMLDMLADVVINCILFVAMQKIYFSNWMGSCPYVF